MSEREWTRNERIEWVAALCRALGIDITNAVSVDIHLRASEDPTATITRMATRSDPDLSKAAVDCHGMIRQAETVRLRSKLPFQSHIEADRSLGEDVGFHVPEGEFRRLLEQCQRARTAREAWAAPVHDSRVLREDCPSWCAGHKEDSTTADPMDITRKMCR